MKIYSKILFVLFLSVCTTSQANSQINAGIVTGYDLYQRMVNPDDGSGNDRSAGSAILSSALGGKVWLGGQKVSLSVEAYANLASLALNGEEYNGLGAISFPVLAKLNFKGVSGFSLEKKFGYYIGGGFQRNKTEFWGLSQRAKDAGVTRNYFTTYTVEVGVGSGTKSKVLEFFVRYGFNGDSPSSALHIGVNTTYSIPFMKKPSFNSAPEKDEDEIIKM